MTRHSLRRVALTLALTVPTIASAAPTQLHWSNAKARPTAVGLVASTKDLDFEQFFAMCDPARRTVSFNRPGLIRAPGNPTLSIMIAGVTYKVVGVADEDIESGGFGLSGEAPYGAPVVKAFVTARSIRLTIDGRAETLPTGDMIAALAAFGHHCGLR